MARLGESLRLRDRSTLASLDTSLDELERRDLESAVPTTAGREGLELLRLADRVRSQAVRRLTIARDVEAHTALGFTTPTRWVAYGSGVSNAAASQTVEVIEFCRAHRLTGAAYQAGVIGFDHVLGLARLC